MKKLIAMLLPFVFVFFALGQSDLPIIGTIAELKGKSKVYLLAETTDSRKLMQKSFSKEKSFEIVGDAKEADFILEFKQISKSTPPRPGMGKFEDIGEMSAYFYNSEKRKVVAWSETKDVYDGKTWGIPPKNETALIKRFLKELKEVNK